MQQKLESFYRLTKKSLHILYEDGPKALLEAYKERRKFQKSIVPKVGEPLNKKEYDTKLAKYYGKLLQTERLSQLITKLGGPIVLALSQDNYIDITGGVQLTIDKQAQKILSENKYFMHVFPYWARKTLDFSKGNAYFGVSINRKFLGFIEEKPLLQTLKNLLKDKLLSVHIHHAMAFRLDFLDDIISINRAEEVFFWIHDFFTLCPNYFLLRNDHSYCGAPPLNSNACTICKYGSIRPRHLEGFVSLFRKYNPQVIAPSQFALNFWQQQFPLKNIKGEVRSHGEFKWNPPQHKLQTKPAKKVAFVGFPVFHKGWHTWLKLTETFKQDTRYEFYLFSNEKKASSNFRNISVTVTADNPNAMINALRKHEIDIAVLWSICPETYSYTLREALEAGAFVITNPLSGNIRKQVEENNFGIVLEDEKALLEYFKTGQFIKHISR